MRRLALFTLFALVAAGCQRSPIQVEGKPRQVFSAPAERIILASTETGALYALAADPGTKRLKMMMSHDGGDHFMPPVFVSPEGSEVQYRGENAPSLLARGMNVYSVWQQPRARGGSDIVFAKQSQMGAPFSTPVRILDKAATDTSFNGFSSMALGPRGEIYVVWLDGRNTASPPGTFSLYIASAKDKGQTFSPNMLVATSTCPCCRPAVAVDDDGTVYVAWRKVFDGDIRDIVVAASKDGGQTFSAPVKAADDRWLLHACPESGPVMDVHNGKLSVAWFSEGSGTSGIRFVRSNDAARSFSAPVILSKGIPDANHPSIATDGRGDTVVSFQGRDQGSKDTWGGFTSYVAKVNSSGQASDAQPLRGADGSSYPTLAVPGLGQAIFAWTSGHGDQARVMMTRARF
jgi:hypothetical protein